jgi:urea transport system ATP-binding protein
MLNVSGVRAGCGQSEALHGIDFGVAPGEIVVFVGRNGMGQDRLMKSLIGMVPVWSGSIMLDGTDLAPLRSYARVAKGLAFVPHGRMIFPTMTVQENIETGQFVHSGKQVPPDLYSYSPFWKRCGHAAAVGGTIVLEEARADIDQEKVARHLAV